MDLQKQLAAQNARRNTVPGAVWVAMPPARGIVYDILVFDARQIPSRDDEGKENGKQTLIKGILHFQVDGWKPTKRETVVYPAGSEISLYIDAGRKTDALVAAVKESGLTSFDEMVCARMIFSQDGEIPPTKQGFSPTKLYKAIIYPVGSPEQMESPYIDQATKLHAEEEEIEREREAVLGSKGSTHDAQPSSAPIAARPLTAAPIGNAAPAEAAPAAPAPVAQTLTTDAPAPAPAAASAQDVRPLSEIIGQ